MLLVDDDQPEPLDRSEDGRPGPDDDPGLAAGDALPLVAALRLGQPRVQDGDGRAEPRPEPRGCLRREGDLGDEDDRRAPARERGLAGADVDLGLPAPRRAVQQEVARASERADDPIERRRLRRCELGGRGLGVEVGGRRAASCAGAADAGRRRDQGERPRRGRAVEVREPEGELDERRGDAADHPLDRDGVDALGRLVPDGDDDAAPRGAAERDGDDRARLDAVGEVGERPRDGARGHERVDRGEPRPRLLARRVGSPERSPSAWSPSSPSPRTAPASP